MSKIVAVCGSTGQQGGGAVAALLRLGGFKVRGLTRDPASAASQKLAAQGVEMVPADFDDPASLRAAFEGADAVFAVTDFWKSCGMDPAKELAQGKNIVDAAKAAGVGHVVWSTLEDTRPLAQGLLQPITGTYTVPHFDAKSEVEQHLRQELPGRWTCLLTSVFYENLEPGQGFAPHKQPDGSFVMAMPTGDAKLSWCSTHDIGNVAAEVIAGGSEKFGGKTVPVSCDHKTWMEVAEAVGKLTGKKVIGVTPPADAWVEQLKSFGVPELAAKDLANMCVYYDKVGMIGARSVEETKAVYPGVQDLEAWLEDHRQLFLGAMA